MAAEDHGAVITVVDTAATMVQVAEEVQLEVAVSPKEEMVLTEVSQL